MIISGGPFDKPILKKANESDEEKYARLVSEWKILNTRFDQIKYVRTSERQSVRAKLESLNAALQNLARKINRKRERDKWLQSRTSQQSIQIKEHSDESPHLTKEISTSSSQTELSETNVQEENQKQQ